MPVDDDVVGVRDSRTGLLGETVSPFVRRPRERVMNRAPAMPSSSQLEHREVGDPQEREALVVDQSELATEVEPKGREDLRRRSPVASREEQRLPGGECEPLELRVGEKLRNRRANFARRVVPDQVRQPSSAVNLRELLERSKLGPRERLRDAKEADSFRVGEDAELRLPREPGRILELEREARIRFVRAKPTIRLRERHALPRRLDLDAKALAPDPSEHLLHRGEELLAVREAQLHVELRQLLHPVGPEILVAEADRDLVVAVEAGDHRQLLQDLRALWEREEAALVQPTRDDEIARPLRCRLEENRCLEIEEARRLHVSADDPDHLRP